MRRLNRLLEAFPADSLRIDEVAKQLGLGLRRATDIVKRGPLPGTWWNGALIVRREDLARFVAERQTA